MFTEITVFIIVAKLGYIRLTKATVWYVNQTVLNYCNANYNLYCNYEEYIVKFENVCCLLYC